MKVSYKNAFKPSIQKLRLKDPLKYKKPVIVFVNSMSDLFHPAFPLEYIQDVFEVMNKCPQHQFQILTKRSERALELSPYLKFTDNIWMGTSVGTNGRLHQIEILRQIPSKIRFISYEPLLVRLRDHNLECIHWAILGGGSPGIHGMRSSKLGDFISLIKNCDHFDVKVFVKQLGRVLGKRLGVSGIKGNGFQKLYRDVNIQLTLHHIYN